jgi:transposase
MANVLKVNMQSSIVVLKQRGFSLRCIARMLELDRETVTRYVRLHAAGQLALPGESPPKPATISTAGSEAIGPGAPPDLPAGRPSKCSGLAETIERLADQGLSAVRIHQELRDAHGFAGSYQSVKRFVGRLRRTRPELVRRLECGPGEELQFDFGRGAPVK